MAPNNFNLLVLAIKHNLLSKPLEKHSVFAFLSETFVNALVPKLKELKPEKNEDDPPHLCALRVRPHERPLKPCILPLLKDSEGKMDVEYRVLYKPEAQNFPLVDGFFFLESQPKTLVGLQTTTANVHHTITSTVKLFKERVASYFNGWEELSRELSWEIIYVQHADSTPIIDWQKCNDSANLTEAENREIAAFWEEKVQQYQVTVTAEM
ncbi:putative retrotransposon hot spot protein (RHS,) [Trypanosoma cruzi]|uniref:Putative retrotransposon hot spot protein (RHS,) n=1 Tax=Trypanosoma cruzi TaxID=5693 RepID=A0A2V2UXA1_TRYCR|nr:putative retrotransposon hot spot protein (RHS,) [Trypanosoma cruzi]